jgi:NAD(P)-dependent dehydrogenase (short-subunit alcohol dehydrogenase family)
MELARRDFEVHLWGRRVELGEKALLALKNIDKRPAYFQVCDVTSVESIQAAARAFDRHADHLDVLVNAAGILQRGTLGSFKGSSVIEQINTLLTGTILVANALATRLAKGKQSIVVNIGSVAGREPFSSLSAYGAAKAGVAHFTKIAAKELFGSGVRVICVCPGVVRTSLMDEAEFAMVKKTLPGRRLQAVEEVTFFVGHLVTGQYPSLTGAVIDLDDGISLFSGGPEGARTSILS